MQISVQQCSCHYPYQMNHHNSFCTRKNLSIAESIWYILRIMVICEG